MSKPKMVSLGSMAIAGVTPPIISALLLLPDGFAKKAAHRSGNGRDVFAPRYAWQSPSVSSLGQDKLIHLGYPIPKHGGAGACTAPSVAFSSLSRCATETDMLMALLVELYIESVYHDCDPSANSTICALLFTKVPAGKMLVILNFSCNIQPASGSSVVSTAFLKVANGGTEVAIPLLTQVGSLATNQNTWAFAAPGYAPSFIINWTNTANGDMTCNISGWVGTLLPEMARLEAKIRAADSDYRSFTDAADTLIGAAQRYCRLVIVDGLSQPKT